jgi:hypothetical protein
MSDRQKLFYALLASAFFHIALALILASWTAEHTADVVRELPRDLSQLTVTIMPTRPTPPPAAAKPEPTIVPMPTALPVLDSDGLTRANKAPAHAAFQSDANMAAGSQLPATGNLPMPTQNGPTRKFMDFKDQAASFGKGETAMETLPARMASQPPAPAMPEQSPSAITQVKHAQAFETPAPTPAPTPKPAPTPAADTLALGTPTPTPAPPSQLPTPVAELAKLTMPPSLRGHADIAPMTRTPETQPAPPQPQPGRQDETEKTHIDGGITAPGPEGVDAVETPFGRYHHKLFNLIRSRWQLYLKEHPTDVGEVTILVQLDTTGKVAGTRVVKNDSLDNLAELSTRAITESDFPPVPDDLAPMLRDGKLEVSFNFSVYDPSHDIPGR